MFFQLLDGSSSVGTVLIAGVAVAMLAVARVVKNLPKDSFSKFFEHRTTKYRIIADDEKGRVAEVQKQRLVFLAFFCVCVAVVVLVFVNSGDKKADVPAAPLEPTATQSTPTVR
ncbi:hypothetical protein [Streptomyces sp. NPDC057694]|uniref:hypothetical protein n=1 Tax=Streptomyces sp. NPDC057694 TaxID=3346216 RepID=UPI00368907FA